jgi:hypothetical protein
VRDTSATTGMPHVMVRRNMEKIRGVLAGLGAVLDGLTRGLDLDVLDRGLGEAEGHAVSFAPRAEALGVVLPSNSPGVHALWVPTLVLKTALVLKPGSAEPWTPYRIAQGLFAAGLPPEALGYYPTDHAGATAMLLACGRGMVFGDTGSTARWSGDPRVEVHGPGYSKVRSAPTWPTIGAPPGRDGAPIWTTAGAPASRLRDLGDARRRHRPGPGRAPRRVRPLPAEDEAAHRPSRTPDRRPSAHRRRLALSVPDVTAERQGGRPRAEAARTCSPPRALRGPDHPSRTASSCSHTSVGGEPRTSRASAHTGADGRSPGTRPVSRLLLPLVHA